MIWLPPVSVLKHLLFRPTQDNHIFEGHEILGNVVRWNKIEMEKLVEYFNEKRREERRDEIIF